MDMGWSLTINSSHNWNDVDAFDISSLFPDPYSDYYKLDLNEIVELPFVSWNQDIPASHLLTDVIEIPAISHPIRVEEPADSSPSMTNFEPMEFLNFEEESEGHTEDKGDSSNYLSLSHELEAHDDGFPIRQDGPGAEEQHLDAAIVFLCTMDTAVTTPSEENHQSSAELGVTGSNVGAQKDHSASNKNEEGDDVNVDALPANPGVPSTQDLVQCPRCQSFDTKFCYYNNRSTNQSRRLCRSCDRQWTVGGTLRPRNPRSAGVRRRRVRESSQTSLDAAGKFHHNGLDQRKAAAAEGAGPPRTNDGHGSAEASGRNRKHRNKQPVRKRKSVPSPVNALASELTFLRFSSDPGECSTAVASLQSFDLSQLSSIPGLRSNSEDFWPSEIADVVPFAFVKNAAIQIAQRPRIYAGEPGPEFQAIIPSISAQYSLPEILRSQHGPAAISLLHQLQNATLATANAVQWRIPQEIQFKDVGARVSSASHALELGLDLRTTFHADGKRPAWPSLQMMNWIHSKFRLGNKSRT